MERAAYILFSRTNTGVGKLIRFFMRQSRYNHVSVARNVRLDPLYAFARKRYDSPFSGGFVREYPSRYLAAGADVPVRLCRVPLDEAQYARFERRLNDCLARRDELLYNLPDAILLPLHRHYSLADAYTCLAFAAYLIGAEEVGSIGELEERLLPYTVYEGPLGELLPPEARAPASTEEALYFTRCGRIAAAHDFFSLCHGLWRRRMGH